VRRSPPGLRVTARAERFPLFDGLRAVAALSVLVFHAAFVAGTGSSNSVLRPYTARLDVGVTIFFLISGFLLYRPFVRTRLRAETMPSTGAYAWRRFLRIVPAYWVALTAVTIWLSLPYVFSHVPLFYGFGQIYNSTLSSKGIPQAWTLCVEVTFYLFLPLWARVLRWLPRRAIVTQELIALALLFAFSLLFKVWALRHTSAISLASAPWLQPLPNFLDQFAVGMALAVLTASWEDRPTAPRAVALLRNHPTLAWLAAAVVFWAVSTQIGLTGATLVKTYPSHTFLLRHEAYTLVALGLILPAIFADPGRGLPGRLLASRPVRFLGLISYSLFLYHLAVVEKINDWLGNPLDAPVGWRVLANFVLGLIGSTAVAAASYYAIERPALRLKRLVRGRRRHAVAGEAIVEPAGAAPAAASTTSATSAGWRKRGTP